MIPYRVEQALTRGELGFKEFGLLVFLILAEDFRTREIVTTLAALADRTQWPGRDREHTSLRRALHSLASDGWIEYESTQGQRRPYQIRLARAAVIEVERQDADVDIDVGGAGLAEVTSAQDEVDNHSGPRQKRIDAFSQLPPRRGSKKRTEKHIPKQEPFGASSSTAPGQMTSNPSALAAEIEKARQAVLRRR